MSTQPYLLIAAGGTGGHMFPAQALSEAMLDRGWRVSMATDARGARYAGNFPEAVTRQVTAAATFAQGSKLTRALTPLTIARGVATTTWEMYCDRPDVVIGFGGYPALPAMAAAGILRIPRLIHEQNGVLGRVNRHFASRVDLVACGTWPTPLPEGAVGEHVGNPVRATILEAAGAPYRLSPDGGIDILVIGGSQGAGLFSSVVPEAISKLPWDIRDRLRLSQQVRPEDMESVQQKYAELEVEAELRPFFDDVPERLAWASLVISRSGASSVADITVMGRPAVLIPYAAALDDHQNANAQGLVDAGGAFVIQESELTPKLLAGHITEILSDPEGAAAMAQACLSQGKPDATAHLAELVEALRKTKGRPE